MANDYAINYEDDRFKAVEQEKNEAISNVKKILETAEKLSNGKYNLKYDISLVRGQGYYTGTVFEVESNKFKGAIIMVTHDKKTALRGNRVLYVKDGKVYGECDLGVYAEDRKEREAKLNSFLAEMGW